MLLEEIQIQKIDKLIEGFNEIRNYDSAWNAFAAYICKCFKIEPPGNNVIKGLFTQTKPFTEKKFIGTCLLRIYNLNPEAVTYDKGFQISVFKYFDNTLMDVYRICGLRINSQGYEKQSQLSDFVSNLERELAIHLGISSLKETMNYEYVYRKLMKEKKYFEVFNFFMADLNTDSLTSKIFENIRNYLKSNNISKLNAYQFVIKDIESLISRVSELNTKYCNLFIVKPFTSIKSLIDADFSNCPIGKPANLIVRQTGKKYPFLVAGERFPINLEIVNSGEGFAYDSKIRITNHNSEIGFQKNEIDLGTIDTEKSIRNIDCEVIKPEEMAFIELIVQWQNFDGNLKSSSFELEIESQTVVNWEELKLKQPYILKPVESEDELIGRTKKLNELIGLCRNSDSCFVTGQKRVGKTSLVRILKEKIAKDPTINTIAIYVALQPDATIINTIDTLAKRICNQIRLSDERLSKLTVPEINHSFGAIYDFLTEVISILKDHRILIIIDEFDQLPLELYRRGDIGDSFFMALKNLSTESKISFILVGGERMAFIKNVQAIHLNLFKTFSLDYFDAETSWNDFEELVRHPVKSDLNIDSSAIQYLYSYTLGHPYFTKKICQELYSICVDRHDSHVTDEEMKKAIMQAISISGVNDFAHFWDDGIMEKGDKLEELSVIRRKVFLSLLETSDTNGNGYSKAETYDISHNDYENIINEFVIRRIVNRSSEGVVFRVKFFFEWLKKYGRQEIFTTPADTKAIDERKKQEALAVVRAEEIAELIQYWGPYSGKEITSDKIRAWLNQFGGNPFTQRLMFKILQDVQFYDNNLIRVNSRDIYKSIIRKLTHEKLERVLDASKRKRDDIIVSNLESSLAKSGSEYAKIFADENSIYADYAISKYKLPEYLNSTSGIRAIIFIDDFAGTGDSVCKNLKEINENIGDIIRRKNILVFVGIICGYDRAKRKIQNFAEHFDYKVEVIFAKELDESDRCFSDFSKVFPFVGERNQAKSICLEIGEKLVQKNPLGFGDCQSLVVFPNACPNNSLPILWQETNSWIPLFKRT